MHYFYYLATNYGINFWVFFTAQKKKKILLKTLLFKNLPLEGYFGSSTRTS